MRPRCAKSSTASSRRSRTRPDRKVPRASPDSGRAFRKMRKPASFLPWPPAAGHRPLPPPIGPDGGGAPMQGHRRASGRACPSGNHEAGPGATTGRRVGTSSVSPSPGPIPSRRWTSASTPPPASRSLPCTGSAAGAYEAARLMTGRVSACRPRHFARPQPWPGIRQNLIRPNSAAEKSIRLRPREWRPASEIPHPLPATPACPMA